jgi:hypothetical protein
VTRPPFRRIVVIALALILAGRSVHAQSVVNPTTAEFDPSADHNTVLPDGTAAVQSYQLGLYYIGASAPFQTFSLGKPAPQSDGKVRVNLSTLLVPLPTPGIDYTSDVAAIGPGGTARSTLSNTFSWAVPCSYSVSPLTASVAYTANTSSTTVTAGTGCTWTAVSNVAWITLSAGASGSGNGTVSFAVAANAATTSRSGTLTVAGQTVTVTQAAAPCAYTASPTSQTLTSNAGTGSVSVTTTSGCSWTARSDAPWVTITAGASGSGSGTVAYSALANTTTTSRTGTLTVAGRTVSITQSGVSCTYTISPTTQAIGAPGGTASVAVTASASVCTWTAASGANWITVTSSASGTGSGIVSYSVAANTQTSTRSGTVTVSGQSLSVNQAAAQPPKAPTSLHLVTN